MTAVLSAVVADDEPLGRRGIVSRLQRSERARVRVVAECADGRQAVEAVRALAPDVLFLDVRMPGLDGFGVVDALPPDSRPHVVFVTAHDHHAVEAFRVRALDYLLKPIDDARFEEALDRVIGARAARSRDAAPERLSEQCFRVRTLGRIRLVRHAEIDWIGAEGDYLALHASGRTHLVRETMGSVEKRLPAPFLRIHRSTIVNADRVRELVSCENGDYRVLLEGGEELRLSRTRRNAAGLLMLRASS